MPRDGRGPAPGQLELVALPRGPAQIVWRRNVRARRVSLKIDVRRGAVVVTLPQHANRAEGHEFLLSQADWVSERLNALPHAIAFDDGAAVALNGRSYRIRHMPAMAGAPTLHRGELHVGGPSHLLAGRVDRFLRGEARRQLGLRVTDKATLADVRPRRVLMKDPDTRWASCTADGTLAFSWRLVMAPGYVQDYVTSHEVAHLRHMDHGPRFWRLVGSLSPHRQKADEWLGHHGPALLRVGS